jgi:hypothetical protein
VSSTPRRAYAAGCAWYGPPCPLRRLGRPERGRCVNPFHRYLDRGVDVILQCPSKASSRSTGFVDKQNSEHGLLRFVRGNSLLGLG